MASMASLQCKMASLGLSSSTLFGQGLPNSRSSPVEAPIHSSNVMLYSKMQNVASRVGHKVLEDGRKVRYLLKTGEVIDSPENWKKIMQKDKELEKTA